MLILIILIIIIIIIIVNKRYKHTRAYSSKSQKGVDTVEKKSLKACNGILCNILNADSINMSNCTSHTCDSNSYHDNILLTCKAMKTSCLIAVLSKHVKA